MNQKVTEKLFKTTALRILKRQYKYFALDRERISEFETRHVMTKVLEEMGFPYGIELRTDKEKDENVGLVDLVIFSQANSEKQLGWVEFKRGAASEQKISKDFYKMLKQKDLDFAGFYHLIPQQEKQKRELDRKPNTYISNLLNRYERAHANALNVLKNKNILAHKKEFILFLLDGRNGEFIFKFFKDIRRKLDFFKMTKGKIAYEKKAHKIALDRK